MATETTFDPIHPKEIIISPAKNLTKTDYPELKRINESMDFAKKHETILERVKYIIKYDKSARKGRNSYLWLLMVYYAKCGMIKIIVPLEDFWKITPPASIERARRELYKMAKEGDSDLKWLLDDTEFLEEMEHEEEMCHNLYEKHY